MNEKPRVKAKPDNKGSTGSIHALLARKQELRKQPPTDEKLAQVWPAWNACPADFLPEELVWTLTGSPPLRCQEALKSLRTRFEHLPLDGDEFYSTLLEAHRWAALINFARVTEGRFPRLVQRQWAFEDADSQAYARIAIFRAVRELRITNRGLLANKSPTLAAIQLLHDRYEAYMQARLKAYPPNE